MTGRRKPITKNERKQRLISRTLWVILIVEAVGIAALVLYFYVFLPRPKQPSEVRVTKQEVVKKAPEAKTGKIITEEQPRSFSIPEVQRIVLQTNKDLMAQLRTKSLAKHMPILLRMENLIQFGYMQGLIYHQE